MGHPHRLPTGTTPGSSLASRAQWLALGVGTRRLSSDEFLRVLTGWFTPAAQPATLNVICRRLQRTVLPGAVISCSTAALLLGIPLPPQLERGAGLLAAAAAPPGRTTISAPRS